MLDQKNILFIIDHLNGGGAERIILDVANQLSKKYNVTIALLDSKNLRMLIAPEIKTIHLNVNSDFMSGALWRDRTKKLKPSDLHKIQDLLNHNHFDMIILSHWYALHIAPFIQGNVWSWIHGDLFNPEPKKTRNLFRWYKEQRRIYCEKKYFPLTLNNKNIIFVNKNLENQYKKYLNNARTVTIYNGIDEKRLNIKNTPQEKKWDCIFVGRLSSEKQPEYAIQAFKMSGLNGKMAIVGDGAMLEGLKRLCEDLEIQDRVDFLGWQDSPSEFISKSKLLIMSSKLEGFGLVIAEALLLNTPVVAFNCSEGVYYQLNSNELVKGLVEPQNLEQLAFKVQHLVNHPYIISDEDKSRLTIDRMITEIELLM